MVYSLYCISHCLLTVQSVPPYCLKGKILHDRYSWRQWAFEKLLTVPSVFGKRNVWFIMSMMSLIPPCHPTHVQNNVKIETLKDMVPAWRFLEDWCIKEAYLSQTACLSVILLKLKTSLMALRNNVPSKQQSRYTLVLPRPCTAATHSLQIGKAMLIFSTNPNPKYFKCSWKAKNKF